MNESGNIRSSASFGAEWADRFIAQARATNRPTRRETYDDFQQPVRGTGNISGESERIKEFRLDLMNTADEVVNVVVGKQKDYGSANINSSPFGPVKGLTVRLYDKIARLANLSSHDNDPENESLRDTFMDIAGYGLIGLMILDETFPRE